MKLIDVWNGWKVAPHLWWRYLLIPFSYDSGMPRMNGHHGYFTVQVFGFAFFIERSK